MRAATRERARTSAFRTKDGRPAVIRPARPRDARAALAITREALLEQPPTLALALPELWSAREWRRQRRGWQHDGVWLATEVGGVLAATLTAHRSWRVVHRHEATVGIVVGAPYRGIGIGRALMETVERWAREVGVERLALGVFAHNERARALYASCGYEEEGVQRRAARFADGDRDIVLMAKWLER